MSDARDLRADTALTRDPANPSRFRGEINEGWKVVYVFGGVTMYTALRAMQEALNRPELPLVTANAIYLAPVPPGPITIDVEVLRDGRRASQVAADLRVGDSDQVALRVHGVFGAAHDTDLTFQEVRCPEVPRPQDSPEPPTDRPNPFGHIPFHEQTLWRPVSPLDDPGRGQFLSWVRLARDADPDLLMLAVHGDVLGPAVGRGLGPRDDPFMVLSLEIGIRFVATPVTQWVLQEIEAWHVGDGYATGPARLWDESGKLCAIATQTANVRVFTPNATASP